MPEAAKLDDVKQLRDSIMMEIFSTNMRVASIVDVSNNLSLLDAYMTISAEYS